MEEKLVLQDITEEDIHNKDFIMCAKCKKIIETLGGDDNWLARNPYECNHWCNKCFKELKDWISRRSI